MGGILSATYDRLFGPYRYKITLVGLDNAGKTTILYRLTLGETVETVPTVGTQVETVNYKNIAYTIWDLAGQECYRSLWASMFEGSHVVILAIDSSDRERISVVKYELQKILQMDTLSSAALLIYANKQDIEGGLTPVDIANELELTDLKRPFHIQGCCALTGDGLLQGLEWIATQLKH